MRKYNPPRQSWTLLIAAASAVSIPALALADTPIVQFIPGDFLIMRGGDPLNSNGVTGADYGGEANAYVDEYSQAGYYVGTLALPQMTLPGAGASSHEGNLDLSPNGQWIAFAGYDPVQNPAGINPHNTDGSENTVLGEINLNQGPSSLNASTVIRGSENFPNSLTGQFVHAAMTIDGNEFYVAGKYNETAGGRLETNDTGLLYVAGTGGAATTTVLEGGTDWRNVADDNGQLYGATGSSSVGTHGAYTIGNGLPTTNNPIPAHVEITNYPGGQSASNLGFANVATTDTAVGVSNGYNVLYTIGDQSASGIVKYDYTNGAWNHDGNQATLTVGNNVVNPYGLVVNVDPTNPSWVDVTVSGQNGVYSYVDKSGDPAAGIAPNSFTQLINPPSYASFYGMAQNPGPANLVWANSSAAPSWNVGSSSSWTYAASGITFADGENVTFDDSSMNSQPIALNSVVQPGSVTVNAATNNYTITGSGSIAGSGVLRLLPGNTSTFTLDTSNTYTGETMIDGGTLVLGVAGALPAGSNVINNGTLSVKANNSAGNVTGTGTLSVTAHAVLTLSASTIPDTAGVVLVSSGSTLDVTTNRLFIQYGSAADPASTIQSYLAAGYNGGAWNGSGINSSAVATSNATQSKLIYDVGFADGADGVVNGLSSGQIEIMPTLAGDAKLQGNVNFGDFQLLAANFGSSAGWDGGNFTYGSIVNFGDFQLLAQNFGANSSALTATELAPLNNFASQFGDKLEANSDGVGFSLVSVPEPASAALVAMSGIALLRARRRKL